MKATKRMIVLLMATVILAGGAEVSTVQAKPDCPLQGFGKHGGMFRQILTRLDLSDSQERDIAGILKQHREQMQDLRTQMVEARKAEFTAMTANPMNEAAVREAAARAADCEVQLAVNRAKVFDEVRKLLTPEQQKTLQQTAEEFASRRHKHFEHKGMMLDRWIEENHGL